MSEPVEEVRGQRSDVGGQEPGARGRGPGAGQALVVKIPAGIRSKEKLFAVLADKLRFPMYFGWNWDALEECLRDLSWLPPEMGVAIVHQDLPFGSGGQNREIYLAVLRSAAAYWAKNDSRGVTIDLPD